MTAVLKKRTLVLNKNWVALGTVSVKRALKHLWKCHKDGTPVAKVIDPQTFEQFTWATWSKIKASQGEMCVRSVSVDFKVPKVIIFQKYDKFPRMERSNFNRKNIFRRDKNTCQYCGKRFPTEELSLDHVIPKAMGGKGGWDNIVCACVECNRKKACRTPEQAGMHLINGPPVKPDFKVLVDVGEYCDDWAKFLDAAYWNVPLQQ